MKLTRKKITLAVLVMGGLLVYVARSLYLPYLGGFLIVSMPLEKVDAIVVLAGDDTAGSRLLEGVALLRAGWGEVLVLSDAPLAWGVTTGEVMRKQAQEQGLDPAKIIEVHASVPAGRGLLADSTLSESRLLLAECKRQNFKKVIVVTSNFHTRRAKRLFDHIFEGSGIRVFVHPAADNSFRVDLWWTRRADLRMWLLEMEKLAFSYLELP